ncbi:hypothetical protein IMSHALPRED_011062 [Imshaugia aleurites]|uniref:Uncharacterized protein n=1 Tax=Imshaugia aleurites TaxID=172621 RepID=A0A8H3IR42_9LECA|nr:hypothetical protein IMSHALPRED_011062 [Imshaugia aleurites]
MGSTSDNLGLGEPRVSSLDQSSPPYWNRSLYCFKLQSDYKKEEITRILGEALKATFADLPVLTGQLVSVDDEKQLGKKDIVPGGNEELFVKDLTSSSLDYDHLKANRFPLSTFDDETFWATPCVPAPGEKCPVFAAQANFIKGGWLLGISFWHVVMDGTAVAIALRVLAQNCLHVQDPSSQSQAGSKLSGDMFNKSRLHESGPEYKGQLSDHPEYVYLPEVPTGPPPFATIPLKVEVFHISPASLKALKAAATPVVDTESHAKEPMWVSTNDAASALIWRSLMVATYEGTDYKDEPLSCCQVAVNARPKLQPPLPNDYFGCALSFGTSNLPISSILVPGSLSTMALMIRQSIMKVTAPYVESVIATMHNVPDYRRFVWGSFMDLLGRNTVQTSWSAFPLYEYNWGPALGGKCERVRAPKLGMFNGLQTVLPALPESQGGGFELMIGLEPHVMEKLKADPVWSEYCKPIED